MSYTVLITRAAVRDLGRSIPTEYKEAIDSQILRLESNPRPENSIKLTASEDLYRLTVGDYRVIYSIDDARRKVLIEKVGDRKEVYRFLRR